MELLQRIEAAIGKRLEEFPEANDREMVMLLSERVGEAQRAALRELQEMDWVAQVAQDAESANRLQDWMMIAIATMM